MKIGLDFDNTIVNYDKVFYDVALEWEIIPKHVPANKLAVRNFLREAGNEDRWTEMQGYVYGARMDGALLYPGLIDFVQQVKKVGRSLVIISHKTAYPFLGPKYDLHAAARHWIEKNVCLEGNSFFNAENIFFEPTKEKKLERIAQLKCDVFVDDLPEIISSPNFPGSASAILFDPDRVHTSFANLRGAHILSSWAEIQQKLGLNV